MAEKPQVKREITEKEAILGELFREYGNTRPIQLMLKLMHALINEYREHNDEIEESNLKLNQGKISMCKQLIDYLTRPMPT